MTHNTLERLHTYTLSHKGLSTFAMLFIIATLMLSACGGGSSGPQSKEGGNLNVGLSSDLITLDPLKSAEFVERQVMTNMYDTLVQVGPQNQLLPDLATSWSYTSPTRLIFTLRTGVKFQDGTPFNADAVVFDINRILTTPSSPRYSELTSVKSVQAIDASHVAFNLKQPFSPLVSTMAFYSGMMLSPTAIKKEGANFGNDPVGAGTGPFEFSKWVKGDYVTITKNPYYWQKDAQGNPLPYLNSVTYRPITNENTMYSNLQTGTIQAADSIAPNDVASAKANPNITYKQIPGLSFYGIALNTQAPPFNNVYLRRAVQYGINREEIVNNVLKGVGVVAKGPITPSSWAYDKNYVPYTYNIQQSKANLALGGKPNGFSFTLLIGSGSPLNMQEAQYIQAELQPAGISMQVKPETADQEFTDAQTGHFQAATLFYSGRPDPDGNMYYYFHTGGGYNSMKYSDPKVDTLLDAARTTSDQQARTVDYQQAQKLIMQDAPWVFTNYGVAVQATTTNVQNFQLQQTDIMMFEKVYLKS